MLTLLIRFIFKKSFSSLTVSCYKDVKDEIGLRLVGVVLLITQAVYGKVSRKKVSVLLDFVQMRGGGPAQIIFHLFISAFLVP